VGQQILKVIGLISGTSFDAAETAAAELHLENETVVLRPLGARSFDFDAGLREAMVSVLPPATTGVRDVAILDTRLGEVFAASAAGTADEFCGGRADLVVSHGQTVFHWVEENMALGTRSPADRS
jgi:anhydro-N-acetylmuramic acid kinase